MQPLNAIFVHCIEYKVCQIILEHIIVPNFCSSYLCTCCKSLLLFQMHLDWILISVKVHYFRYAPRCCLLPENSWYYTQLTRIDIRPEWKYLLLWSAYSTGGYTTSKSNCAVKNCIKCQLCNHVIVLNYSLNHIQLQSCVQTHTACYYIV